MKFPFREIHEFEDAQRNFEQIETRFSVPTFTAAPSNPTSGQLYFDSTLVKLGYFNGTIWVYL